MFRTITKVTFEDGTELYIGEPNKDVASIVAKAIHEQTNHTKDYGWCTAENVEVL